jgi:formylglycine-generating enzyme required for sulfatase activity
MARPEGGFGAAVLRLACAAAGLGALILAGCGGVGVFERPGEAEPAVAALESLTVGLGGGVAMVLVHIPPGTFTMGSTEEELQAVRRKWPDVKDYYVSNEMPAHRVAIPKGFFMGKCEVTQEQWEAVMGSNPSIFKGPKLAVQASWHDCQEFLKKLNAKTGRRFALPSEAEWEYACRAGTTTRFYFGDRARALGRHAWTWSYWGRVRPVGQKRPNPWGLFDMYGNVYEWCEDVGHESYDGAPCDGSAWLEGGDKDFRVLRGGSWDSAPYSCRSASRFHYFPHLKACSGLGGLRVVLRDP